MPECVSKFASQVIIVIFMGFSLARADDIAYPPPNDYYSYGATVIYDKTDSMINVAYLIEPRFNFTFANQVYSRCWFHTDGRLSFDAPHNRSYPINESNSDKNDARAPKEWIRVSTSYYLLMGSRLLVRATDDNFTIDYSAVRQYKQSEAVRWIITYYRNATNEVYDIETSYNGIQNKTGKISSKKGVREIDTTTPQLVRYIDMFKPSMRLLIGLPVGLLVLTVLIGVLIGYKRRGRRCCCWTCPYRWTCCRRVPAPTSTYAERSSQQIREEPSQMTGPFKDSDPEEICDICVEKGVEVEGICTHRYHLVCLKEWYKRSPRCPYCRQTNSSHMLRCTDCGKFSMRVFGPAVLPAALSSCCNK